MQSYRKPGILLGTRGIVMNIINEVLALMELTVYLWKRATK